MDGPATFTVLPRHQERAHTPGILAGNEVVTDAQGALLHQDGGKRTLARIEGGFDTVPCARKSALAVNSRFRPEAGSVRAARNALAVLAETAACRVVPPNSSSTTLCCNRSA